MSLKDIVTGLLSVKAGVAHPHPHNPDKETTRLQLGVPVKKRIIPNKA